MPDNFEKSYAAYFKILEENLERSQKNNTSDQTSKPVTADRSEINRKKGVYKVIRIRKSVLAVITAILVVVGTILLLPDKKSSSKSNEKTDNITLTEEKQAEIPKTVFGRTDSTLPIPDTNDAKTAIIIDMQNNTVLAERNPNERVYPASTTKIMTLITAVGLITDYSETFAMTYEITDPLFVQDASVAGFLNGEQVSMTDLLYGTILPSGADAAVALAVHLTGSEEEFVKEMNKKVKELGLKNTHFDNATGLHSENNYSSAYDMAVILNEALKDELCREILSTVQYTTATTPQNPDGIRFISTLFSHMRGTESETATISGGKTGFVNESGYCIASFGSNNENGNKYIIVTFGNSARKPAFSGHIDLYKEFAK